MPADKAVADVIADSEFVPYMHDCHADRVIFGLNQHQQFRQSLLWAYVAYGVLCFRQPLRFHQRRVPGLLQPTGQRLALIMRFTPQKDDDCQCRKQHDKQPCPTRFHLVCCFAQSRTRFIISSRRWGLII